MRSPIAVPLIHRWNVRRNGIERQPRRKSARSGQGLIELQIPKDVQTVSADIGDRKHRVAGQLALDAEVPYLGLILLEILCDEKYSESGRRGESSSRRVANIDRGRQTVSAERPKRCVLSWRGVATQGEERVVPLECAASRS